MIPRIVLVILSIILLGAHFSRHNEPALIWIWLLLPALLLFRKKWISNIIQFALLLGASEWIRTLIQLVQIRQAAGQPWIRLILILGSVALFTFIALLLFRHQKLQDRLNRAAETAALSTTTFILTAIVLGIVHLKVQPPMLLIERFFPGYGWLEIFGLSLYAAWMVEKIYPAKTSSRWRLRLWLGFSIVFFLQLLLGLIGFEKFLMSGDLHLPVPALILAGPIYRGAGFFMPILFGVTVLLAGPAWCSYLCYIGAWDNLAAQNSPRPQEMPTWTRKLRLGILSGVVLLSLLLRFAGLPISLALGLAITFGLIGIGLMVLLSRKNGIMTHCIAYCPMGLIANWLGKLSPFRIKLADGCTECQACHFACRYDALSADDIQKRRPGSTCTLCGDCLPSCKGNWIHYSLLNFNAEKSRRIFLTLIIALHAVFLGLARI
jgi:NAD-dependent dihydropyrimidine dehydrogenase PreA subunit